uniref:G-protein coupled receptors family 1 profile domain-containing protein n=1 Tax=Meloidogyne incognita TaxID=6306 RepID=A0A914KPF6_MELIC
MNDSCYYHEPKVHDYELYYLLSSINIYLLLPLSLVGLFANGSALFCLCSPPKIVSGVLVYLKALLILDHVYIIVSLANSMLPDFCDGQHSVEKTFYSFCLFEGRFLRNIIPRIYQTVVMLHIWTIAALSAHRYWKISRPVSARSNDTIFRARVLLAILFLVIVAYRVPSFVVELQWKWSPIVRIQKRPEKTETLSAYRIVFYSILDPILSHFLPFGQMFIFSVLTLFEIMKRQRRQRLSLSSQVGLCKLRRQSSESSQKIKANNCSNQGFKNIEGNCIAGRQKQEYRATISIVLMIVIYLLLHSMSLYNLGRKWELIIKHKCPIKTDYIRSHIGNVLNVLSASVNAFVFIAFTNRMRDYIRALIRKTSRTFSSNLGSNEQPQNARILGNRTSLI